MKLAGWLGRAGEEAGRSGRREGKSNAALFFSFFCNGHYVKIFLAFQLCMMLYSFVFIIFLNHLNAHRVRIAIRYHIANEFYRRK